MYITLGSLELIYWPTRPAFHVAVLLPTGSQLNVLLLASILRPNMYLHLLHMMMSKYGVWIWLVCILSCRFVAVQLTMSNASRATSQWACYCSYTIRFSWRAPRIPRHLSHLSSMDGCPRDKHLFCILPTSWSRVCGFTYWVSLYCFSIFLLAVGVSLKSCLKLSGISRCLFGELSLSLSQQFTIQHFALVDHVPFLPAMTSWPAMWRPCWKFLTSSQGNRFTMWRMRQRTHKPYCLWLLPTVGKQSYVGAVLASHGYGTALMVITFTIYMMVIIKASCISYQG